MPTAYLDCYSGLSGDMVLGALLDVGLPLAALRDQLALLDLAGYSLLTEPVSQSGILGTRLTVRVDQPLAADHRHWSDIRALIERSGLADPIKATALRIFGLLAEAEGAVHGQPPDEVHFHEVGAVDSIVDIVGAAIGFDLLGIDALHCAPLPLGHGFVSCRHGLLPLPAPATLEVIARTGAVTRAVDIDRELVTPTGAAIVGALATFSQPPLRLSAIGYGYGTTALPWPNALRLWLGEPPPIAPTPQLDLTAAAPTQSEAEAELLLETNIDDLSGEILGYLMDRLFAAGALDVFYTPIMMKKNRPATKISIIAPASRQPTLAALLLTETSTFGVRALPITRTKAGRRWETVQTAYGPVRRKRKEWHDQLLDSVPEYEDCAALARQHGVPLRVIYEAARQASPPAGEDPVARTSQPPSA